MSVVSFLDTGFRFKERNGVSDVQAIIDDFAAEVTTPNDPTKKWLAWTNMGGNLFKSPVDAYGKFMDILLTRIAQRNLEVRLRDQTGATIFARRMQGVSANNWTVRIFTGTYHAFVDLINYSALAEGFNCNVLDQFPDNQGEHPVYVCGYGQRTTADVDDSYYKYNYLAITGSTVTPATRITTYCSGGSGNSGRKALSGQKIFRPREVWANVIGESGMYTYWHYAGRCYQQLLCAGNIPIGARIPVPIDTGVLAEFIMLGSMRANSSDWGLCVRSA